MNASLSILQKLKKEFLLSVGNTKEWNVAFAPFASSQTNEDYYFLNDATKTGEETLKYYSELAEFSLLSNSILRHRSLWNMDSSKQLCTIYKDIIDNSRVLDKPLTKEQVLELGTQESKLYNEDGTESVKYLKYSQYRDKDFAIENELLELQKQKNNVFNNDTVLNKYELKIKNLKKKQVKLNIEWGVKGFKNEIRAAIDMVAYLENLRDGFSKKWENAKARLENGNFLTSPSNGLSFLHTSCLPNLTAKENTGIWKTVTLNKEEIKNLAKSFEEDNGQEITKAFGDVNIELDYIEFEYCFLEIIRPWFDETLINNQYWQYDKLISAGLESMDGLLPAYPSKLILAKNIAIKLSDSKEATTNADFIQKIRIEDIRFGSFILPENPTFLELPNETLKIQPSLKYLEARELNQKFTLNTDNFFKNRQILNNDSIEIQNNVTLENRLRNTVFVKPEIPIISLTNHDNVLITEKKTITDVQNLEDMALLTNKPNEEYYNLIGIICKKLPKLPDPII